MGRAAGPLRSGCRPACNSPYDFNGEANRCFYQGYGAQLMLARKPRKRGLFFTVGRIAVGLRPSISTAASPDLNRKALL